MPSPNILPTNGSLAHVAAAVAVAAGGAIMGPGNMSNSTKWMTNAARAAAAHHHHSSLIGTSHPHAHHHPHHLPHHQSMIGHSGMPTVLVSTDNGAASSGSALSVPAHQMPEDASSLSSKLIMASMAVNPHSHSHQTISSSCLGTPTGPAAFLPLPTGAPSGTSGQTGPSHLQHYPHHHYPPDTYLNPLDSAHKSHNFSQIF